MKLLEKNDNNNRLNSLFGDDKENNVGDDTNLSNNTQNHIYQSLDIEHLNEKPY